MIPSSRLCATAVVALTLALWLMLVRPAPAGTLVFGSGVGFPGDVVTVTATLDSQGAGISALGADIRFDSNALSIRTCTLNPAINGKSLATNLVQQGLERFVVFGLNQTRVPDGALFTCEFLVLPSALTSVLTLQTIAASDPQGNGISLSPTPGRIVVLSASAKSSASHQCNLNTCGIAIDKCDFTHGCDGLRGSAAASCRKDCRQGIIAACQADRSISLCD